ncbi:MAG TPA: ThuA domain-containing protein, partial [Asanoa sp.]|nr:ThuA domain-containing protein [Asanoa sp.]
MPSTLRRRLAVLAAATIGIPLVLAPTSAQADPRTTDPAAGNARAADPEQLVAAENGPQALRSEARAPKNYKVLVFTKTAGLRRPSIQDGVATIRALAQDNGFTVTASQDAGAFTADNLATFRAVVFLNTTGDILNATQQGAFEAYIKAGGGYVGVHAAAETEPDWPFYQALVGAKVASATGVEAGNVDIADRVHPATETVPRTLTLTEEWYNFTANVRGQSHVLGTVDETSVTGGTMGFDHPITWCKDYQGGRSFYTGLGHSIETYRAAAYTKHLLGGIEWASGVVEGDCGATVLA